mgnify:CR=1 FL=1
MLRTLIIPTFAELFKSALVEYHSAKEEHTYHPGIRS